MRKGVTFISAGLTAFVMAILAAVVYAYNNGSVVSSLFAQQSTSPQSVSFPLMGPTAIPTTQSVLVPGDAAALAAKFLNRTDLYSIELSSYNSSQVYKVVFVSGDVAYVSMSGQVVGVVMATPAAPPAVVIISSSSGKHRGGGGGNPVPSGGGEGGGGDGGGD